MLDGRISSCLTTLLVHLPSCDQTRPGSDQGLGQGLGGPQSAMTEQHVGLRMQRQGWAPSSARLPEEDGHDRWPRTQCQSSRRLPWPNQREHAGQVGVWAGCKTNGARPAGQPWLDRTDVTGAGGHIVKPRKPQVAGKTRAKHQIKGYWLGLLRRRGVRV